MFFFLYIISAPLIITLSALFLADLFILLSHPSGYVPVLVAFGSSNNVFNGFFQDIVIQTVFMMHILALHT